MKKKTVRPIAHKRALERVVSYEKNFAKGKELQSEVIEKFSSDIAPFLTKKGTVRKNLSAKKTAEFNRLVGEFKKTTSYSKTKSQKKLRKTIETAINRGTYKREESKAILKTFIREAVRDLKDKAKLDSDQVMTLLRDYRGTQKVSIDDFEKVAQYLIDMKDEKTPQEVRDLVIKQDDTIKTAELMLKNIDSVKKIENITSLSEDEKYKALIKIDKIIMLDNFDNIDKLDEEEKNTLISEIKNLL